MRFFDIWKYTELLVLKFNITHGFFKLEISSNFTNFSSELLGRSFLRFFFSFLNYAEGNNFHMKSEDIGRSYCTRLSITRTIKNLALFLFYRILTYQSPRTHRCTVPSAFLAALSINSYDRQTSRTLLELLY